MRYLSVVICLAGPVAADQSGAVFFEACADAYLAAQEKAQGAGLSEGETVTVAIPKRFQLDGFFGFPIAMTCSTLTEGVCARTDDSKTCMDHAGATARDKVVSLVRELPEVIAGPDSQRYRDDRDIVLIRDPDTACPGPNCDLYAEAGLFINWRRLREMAEAMQ